MGDLVGKWEDNVGRGVMPIKEKGRFRQYNHLGKRTGGKRARYQYTKEKGGPPVEYGQGEEGKATSSTRCQKQE